MKRLLALFLLVSTLAASSVRATPLVYEGFASTDYEAGKSINGKKSGNASIGLDTANGWNSGTGVYTAQSNGLSLPDAWTAVGTVHGTQALRGVLYNSTAASTARDNRAQQRRLTCTWPSSGSIYFRFLMQVPSAALNTTYLGSGNYWMAGLGTEAIASPTSASCYIAKGIYMGLRNRDGTLEMAAYVKNPADGVITSYPLFTVDTSKILKCACVAKIDIGANGADTVSFYAAPFDDWNNSFEWTATVQNVALVSGSAKPSYLQMIGQYKVNSQFITFDEFLVTTDESEAYPHAAATAPVLGAVALSRTGAATYSLTAEESSNAADLSYVLDDGTTVTTNGTRAVAAGGTTSWTISGFAPNKTYRISVVAENANGAAEKAAGVIYTGELALGATTDANEYGLVPGGVTVSRANDDPFPLTVNYTISGSAGTEGTTWVAPAPVTIPANAASATLPVVPLMDPSVTADVTITVALAAGNYEIPSVSSKTLTLANLAAPAGKKTWAAAADGLASDGANWLPAGTPTSSDNILFDGNFSNARCTWDAPTAVASWEQAASFTGTVDIQTTYDDGTFPVLAIAGDCTVNGGKWTHARNDDAQVWRLSVSVGGDFVVASGAEITATGKGYASKKFPGGSATGTHGGTFGSYSSTYGDMKHPVTIGSGGNSEGYSGGGAIHLVVTGAATVNGTLSARASTDTNGSNARYKAHGAGGSIYLSAASVSGSGSITAAGFGFNNSYQRPHGTGGRIAVVCTTATTLGFPTANIACIGSIAGYGNTGNGGTIFVKTAAQENGTLILDNAFAGANYEAYWPTKRGVTPIPSGQTWTLDAIEFRRFGVLAIPAGTTLNVPLSGISATSDRTAGILYEGGTLNFTDVAPGNPYTLTGKWTFQADAPYTFNGDVMVTGGANIGGLRFSGDHTNNFAKCDVTVNGNLTIAADGFASVEMAGPFGNNASGTRPNHGGQYADVSGNQCYGSVFSPVLPGHFAQNGDHGTAGVGGGALKLTVTGNLVVNGKVSANATVFHKSSAAAGSVNITAATLSGSGSITATGNQGAIQWDNGYNGVGGRIAVRVTGEDVGTEGVWTKFAARGCATNQVATSLDRNQNTSAGTIYLQGQSDGEKGGTIYVRNQPNYDTSNVATWIPAETLGDAAADFTKAKLVIADRGVVALGAALKMEELSIAANSLLDLKGTTLAVYKASLGGTELDYGTYAAGNEAVAGFVVDSLGGGSLVVRGKNTVILLR